MKKIFYLLLFVSVFAISANAQVKIGGNATEAPKQGAILELQSSNLGFLPPRVELTGLDAATPLTDHVEGMVVYNTKADPNSGLEKGLYYDNGSQWVRLAPAVGTGNWFYMPSVPLDVSTQGTHTLDLWTAYSNQFGTPPTRSASTAPSIAVVAKGQLYFYVTGYDSNVFSDVSVDADGILTYKVIGTADDATYMNIVFMEK